MSQLDGVEVLNFGSEDRDTTVVLGGGIRYRATERFQVGTAYEAPITDKDNTITDYRIYFDFVLNF